MIIKEKNFYLYYKFDSINYLQLFTEMNIN